MTNCYAIDSAPYITTNDQYTDGITAVTAPQLASGEVAYLLGYAFGQDLTNLVPLCEAYILK